MTENDVVFTKEQIKGLIDHATEVRMRRFEKLRNDGATPDLAISFMIGANCILSQLQYFYETGELYNNEGKVE